MRTLRGSNAAAVIATLNPIIKGWAAYHRGVVSSKVFHCLDYQMLTVVDFADEAFIENADVQSGVGRRGDGVFVTVTLIGVKPGAVGVGCSAR
jgi:hypothetical protein